MASRHPSYQTHFRYAVTTYIYPHLLPITNTPFSGAIAVALASSRKLSARVNRVNRSPLVCPLQEDVDITGCRVLRAEEGVPFSFLRGSLVKSYAGKFLGVPLLRLTRL